MPVITFPVSWDQSTMTRVAIACSPEPLRHLKGTVSQAVMTFEMNDRTEVVSVTGGTLLKNAAGEVSVLRHDGQRWVLSKPAARDFYRHLLQQGYGLDEPWLECDSV